MAAGPKKKPAPSGLVAAIGLNVGTDEGEVRYEPGDTIDAEHCEAWMLEDGVVVDANAEPEAASDDSHVEVSIDTIDPDEAARLVENALAAQAESLPADDDGGDS